MRPATLQPHRPMGTLITAVPISLPVPSTLLMPTKLSKLNTVAMSDPSPDLVVSNLHQLMVLNLISMGISMSLVMEGSLNTGNSNLVMDGDPSMCSLRLLNLDLGMVEDLSMGNKNPTMDLDVAGNQSMGNPNLDTDLGMAERPSMKVVNLIMDPDMDGGLRLRASMDRVMEIGLRPNTGQGTSVNRVMGGNMMMIQTMKTGRVMATATKKTMVARNMVVTTVMMMMMKRSVITAISTTTISAMTTMMSNLPGGSIYIRSSCHSRLPNKRSSMPPCWCLVVFCVFRVCLFDCRSIKFQTLWLLPYCLVIINLLCNFMMCFAFEQVDDYVCDVLAFEQVMTMILI